MACSSCRQKYVPKQVVKNTAPQGAVSNSPKTTYTPTPRPYIIKKGS